MNNSKRFMQAAIQLAHRGMESNDGGPFGAVVVKNNKVIAQGYNQVAFLNDPTAHAEVVAIREACKVLNSFQLKGCTIYTSCEPCPMCLGAIYWARPDKVVFGATRQDAAKAQFDDEFIYDELRVDADKRQITFENLLRVEAQKLFDVWNEKEDKIIY